MARFVSPSGLPIVGTLEALTARANATEYSATGEPDYEGDTEVFWDGQTTVERPGKGIVYLDEDGEEWTFDQLSPEPDEDESEDGEESQP